MFMLYLRTDSHMPTCLGSTTTTTTKASETFLTITILLPYIIQYICSGNKTSTYSARYTK